MSMSSQMHIKWPLKGECQLAFPHEMHVQLYGLFGTFHCRMPRPNVQETCDLTSRAAEEAQSSLRTTGLNVDTSKPAIRQYQYPRMEQTGVSDGALSMGGRPDSSLPCLCPHQSNAFRTPRKERLRYKCMCRHTWPSAKTF